ncbi:MAG: 4-hydroxy-tetrahydrodipicolinate reductase [candidate division Zixibacteria bacterium]|nr:4-hydroxy-tetrahydrodipicolinate reductase [candidate division Zixibacteria bacterium]
MPGVKLIIHGLGKVGKLVRSYAQEDADVDVVATVDAESADAEVAELTEAILTEAEVIIDFTHGDAVPRLVETVAAFKPQVRVVVGTSGWEGDEDRVRQVVRDAGLFFLYGANFSVGTAIFMRLANVAAELFDRAGGFDVAVLDVHHRHKKDMPSGTAKKIAAAVLERTASKASILTGIAERPIAPDEIHVNCLRLGENKGYHELYFDAPSEVVRLSQQTRDRGVYAAGALTAAKWLMRQREPAFYTFDQALEDILYGQGI